MDPKFVLPGTNLRNTRLLLIAALVVVVLLTMLSPSAAIAGEIVEQTTQSDN